MLRSNSYGGSRSIFSSSVDWVMILLYVVLVLIGWMSICSASYDETAIDPYSFSHFYVKQVLWIGLSLIVALVVMLLDDKYYHMLAYPAYIGGLLVLIGTLLFGKEVNGAKAWIELGFFSLQPVELVKIATALAMARLMSSYSFSVTRFGDLMRVATIILMPLLIIILQNDTGSGIVLCSFIFVLYREGLNKWLCIPFILIAALFIGSLILTPMTMLVLLILLCTIFEVLMNGEWQSRVIYLATLALTSIVIYLVANYLIGWPLSAYKTLLGVTLLSMVAVVIYAYRAHLRNIFIVVAIFVGSMIFLPTTEHIFNEVLQPHQRDRIYSFLGIKNDPQGIDFNVNQSKIAIGSGGLTGKGFLEGTQVKYNFVPENHTDFIFCTVGEEWGFLGCLFVLALYCTLILRLMRIGERQEEPFGRIYCYCVASILLFHLMVNVGMTIGLMPVMGIPLPFMSYGGSSLMAFTLLLFIAIRFDASRRRFGVE